MALPKLVDTKVHLELVLYNFLIDVLHTFVEVTKCKTSGNAPHGKTQPGFSVPLTVCGIYSLQRFNKCSAVLLCPTPVCKQQHVEMAAIT